MVQYFSKLNFNKYDNGVVISILYELINNTNVRIASKNNAYVEVMFQYKPLVSNA